MKKTQSNDAHPVPSIDTEERPRRLKIMIDRCTSCTIDRCRDAERATWTAREMLTADLGG
ncbi:hypothetical protein F2Q69_00013638 [Brassica cretica]|uniref:Uncharacterized protein n=1 Tax=Brassica cretica TaxID=69181 RepID=A0A8S9R2E2_BRACR|nr:hypothetical protein F2Q69_00013638 [Brassica cretica]